MQIKYRQFPHPVLSHFSDDLVKCQFQMPITVNTTANSYIFQASAKTSSSDLVELIKNKKAFFAVHIECSSTRYRELFTSFEEEFSFNIDADKLNGKVQMCALILAAEDLPNYKNSNFNEDYGDISFKIKKGDVLAVDRDRTFIADKETDPLKNIPSIFTVSVDTNRNAPPFDIDASGHKVVIKLSKENYDRYKILKMSQNMHSTMASLLILPALVSLLEMIKFDTAAALEEYEERRWFRVLVSKLKNIGIDVYNPHSFSDSTIAAAQKLIGDPLTSAFKKLEGYESED